MKRKASNRYYYRSKISEYQIKKLFWLFACDVPPSNAARRMRLSGNTVHSVYGRIRKHFAKAGLFRDFYETPSEIEIALEDEYRFLEFHLSRVERMQGLPNLKRGEMDLHMLESNWRYQYQVYGVGNADANLDRMMFDDLIRVIDIAGPINTEPKNRERVLEYMLETIDRRLTALEKSSVLFKEERYRQELRALRAIQPEK